jgi:hypothetical protein
MHKNGGLFFGTGQQERRGRGRRPQHRHPCRRRHAGDYFELIARQTSASTKNLADDELT